MNHSAALAAAPASAADCTKSPRSVAAQQNQRYTLKGPKAVHDAGSASTGFFTTALRPKPPAQTPRARRRPPDWPQTSKVFAPTTVAHGEHCKRRLPEPRQDRSLRRRRPQRRAARRARPSQRRRPCYTIARGARRATGATSAFALSASARTAVVRIVGVVGLWRR